MTPAEYKSLPANLQRDVRVALACGWQWQFISIGPHWNRKDRVVLVGRRINAKLIAWRDWQPTTDTTIWTALMGVEKDWQRMSLRPDGNGDGIEWWYADYSYKYSHSADTQGEAVCACFVAADPLNQLKGKL